jgi:hypothetical protein
MGPALFWSPGALVPFSGRGSTQEADETALDWAIASNGRIQFTERYRLDQFAYGRGRPPYGRCAATGYLYPRGQMVAVDGKIYIPDFAPSSKDSF